MSETKIKYEIVKCVPFQTCPLCNGLGQVLSPLSASSMYSKCDVCGGHKIIPMAVIPYPLNVEENEVIL